jgi:hypothetical protein
LCFWRETGVIEKLIRLFINLRIIKKQSILKNKDTISRRFLVRNSILGIIGGTLPSNIFAASNIYEIQESPIPSVNKYRYPSIEESIVNEVVGLSHFNLEKVKTLVQARPELAKATWDWGFGDWETALGAASHTGRRDIIEFLLSYGARPDIYTFSALGNYTLVKSMIKAMPGIQKNLGPHGISLLQHAKNGYEFEKNKSSKDLVDYLESLGDADGIKYLLTTDEENKKYLGDYKYGPNDYEGFSIKLNMKKNISLGKIGKNGGTLNKIAANEFIYNGTSSVKIQFAIVDEQVKSLIISEPGLTITANKI